MAEITSTANAAAAGAATNGPTAPDLKADPSLPETVTTTTTTAAATSAEMTTTSTTEQASTNVRPPHENQTQQDSEQDAKRLDELTAAAKLQYSLKNYTAAADLFSSATELQAALHGEMAPENAELLYAYGRCLYQVAVARSDVLGGKVGEEAGAATAGDVRGGEKEKGKKGKKRGRDGIVDDEDNNGKGKGRRVDEVKEEQKSGSAAAAGSKSKTALDSLPEVEGGQKLFQFKGDENFTMSDDEEEVDDDNDGEEGGEAGDRDEDADEDEDDFANAYEILDLARILVKRQRDDLAAAAAAAASDITSQPQIQTQAQNEKESAIPPLRQLDERLADIHDLQAEISLENERFADAVADCRAALGLKKELYPPQSNLVAEAHFKLSLALEFASVTTTQQSTGNDTSADVNGGNAGEAGSSKDSDKQQQQQQQQVDGKMREEAAQEMAAAIESCKLRIAEEEEGKKKKKKEGPVASKTEDTAEEQALAERKEREIADVKEMVEDMEQRLQDLRAPLLPETTPASLLNSLLGSGSGSGQTQTEATSSSSSSKATDLTSLVRRKEKVSEKDKDKDLNKSTGGQEKEKEKGKGKRGLSLTGEDEEKRAIGNGDSEAEGVMSASEGVAEGVKRVRV